MSGKQVSPYLVSAKKQFAYYKMLGERTFEQLDDSELFWSPGPCSNSIAVIVKHLHGNMMSRWTDFLDSDGEKPWRNREGEFEETIKTRAELLAKWEEGWQCLFDALEKIDRSNWDQTIYIRNQGHSVVGAINRQLAHYAYHLGQITYIGVQLRQQDWKSLSIPRGGSKAYNKTKFEQPKAPKHFTDEFLDDQPDTE